MNHSAIRIWTLLAACTALASCSNSKRLDSQLEAEVKSYFRSNSATSHMTVASAWHADAITTSTVCGHMDAKPDGGRLRFVYDPAGNYGQVELAEGTLGDSAETGALIEENRKLFNETWQSHCSAFAPGVI